MSDRPEKNRRDEEAVEQTGPSGDKNEESKKLNHRGPRPFGEAPAIVRESPPASPLRFYARLRSELERRGIDYDGLPRLTPEGGAPPCFRRLGVPFDDWLAAASLLGATVPYRYDMPAEPNYCWDCTPEFQCAAKAKGLCRFPHVRFEKARTLAPGENGKRVPEIETRGVTRPSRLDTNLYAEYDSDDPEPST